jgi:hypothetical protein
VIIFIKMFEKAKFKKRYKGIYQIVNKFYHVIE